MENNIDLTIDERIIVLETYVKQCKAHLDELKGIKKMQLIDAFDQNGTDSMRLNMNGEKMGKVCITGGAAKMTIVDDAAAMDYMEQIGLVDRKPCRGWDKHFRCTEGGIMCTLTGEVVDFVELRPTAVNAAIRLDKPEKVIPAIQQRIGSMPATALLEGGN